MDDIKRNAINYRYRVYGSTGRQIRINHSQRENQVIDFESLNRLNIYELQTLGFLLCHMSKNPGMNAVIENDHFEYWAHVSVVSSGMLNDHWIKNHHPLLSYIYNDLSTQGNLLYSDNRNAAARNLLISSSPNIPLIFPAVWSGYAYLEGICKRICFQYVDVEGNVIKPFRVNNTQYRTKSGNAHVVKRKGKKAKTRCSSIKDLIVLARRHVAPSTKNVLTNFFKDYNVKDIANWRNSALHGSEDQQTTFIVLYCLISILIIDQILLQQS